MMVVWMVCEGWFIVCLSPTWDVGGVMGPVRGTWVV